MKVIAAFDFDGTITTKDTLFDFIRFYVGKKKLILGLVTLSPILILYRIGVIKNYVAKQKMFSYFFKGESINDFDTKGQKYASRIEEIIKSSVIEKIRSHQNQNHKVIIISASISTWIKPWASKNMNIEEVIGTEIEVENGILTGRFKSKNCYGQEKVNRLLCLYPNRDDYTLYAYGDSPGDKQLLELADYPTLLKN
ncbi:MAG: HAD family hydrolase [Dysgonomonas sp.]|nr:HAD family hydrolase [Dysgonomonas sp.]